MRKRSVRICALIVLLVANVSAAKYSGGTGEPNNPYRIETAADMQEIGANSGDWDKHFVLVNDINLAGYTGTEFNIIGNEANPFTGVFDGNNYTVSNFSYTGGSSHIGLFGYVAAADAEIKNLGLYNANLDTPGYTVGSLVGRLQDGRVSGCWAKGGSVSGMMYVGGLVGFSWGQITTSYAAGSVEGKELDGFGGEDIGGLVGFHRGGIISNSYATGLVSGRDWVGGLVGFSWGQITTSYATGSVSGASDVGGLVGYCSYCDIATSYATGTVSGFGASVECAGGLVGYKYGSLTDSYATGRVDGHTYVGGLVGYNGSGIINNSYSTGYVDGLYFIGGLVGDNSYGPVNNCFWDKQTSGRTWSDGGTGKTTADMQTRTTFTDAGWDFVGEMVNGPNDIWTIHEAEDYPKLVWKLVNFVGWYEVDFLDYAFFANRWMYINCGDSNDCDGCDLNFSDAVDANDLKILFDCWLEGAE